MRLQFLFINFTHVHVMQKAVECANNFGKTYTKADGKEKTFHYTPAGSSTKNTFTFTCCYQTDSLIVVTQL